MPTQLGQKTATRFGQVINTQRRDYYEEDHKP